MNQRSRSNPGGLVSSRGFSLVEVLIAVLVLAIGLLGLGAVFPAIIAEQRSALEAIEGENAASAAATLLQGEEFIDFSYIEESFNKAADNGDDRYTHEWVVPSYEPGGFAWGATQQPNWNFLTGAWSYDINAMSSTVTSNPEVALLSVSSRLFPQPYSGKEPRFVWDVALRREPSGDRLQAAIFVRRIDARIRVPRDHSLSDVLTGGNGISFDDTRLPVGIFNDGGSSPRNGTPVADEGPTDAVVYAVIQSLQVEVHPERLDWLIFPNGRDPGVDTSAGFASKAGQKLVDNTGVVRTVVGTPMLSDNGFDSSLPANARVVIVDPPFTVQNAGGDNTDQARPGSRANDMDFDDERASWVRQVIFTPRTPVAVRVVTLEDPQ